MRLHGWCESCRRIKRVTVSGSQLARAGRGVVNGICDECQEAAHARRRR